MSSSLILLFSKVEEVVYSFSFPQEVCWAPSSFLSFRQRVSGDQSERQQQWKLNARGGERRREPKPGLLFSPEEEE